MGQEKRQIEVPHLGSVNLEGIANRNEQRVAACLPEVLQEFSDYEPDRVSVQDIYALALNLLPPRYRQAFSIVLREPVSDDQVREAIRQAVCQVQRSPK